MLLHADAADAFPDLSSTRIATLTVIFPATSTGPTSAASLARSATGLFTRFSRSCFELLAGTFQ